MIARIGPGPVFSSEWRRVSRRWQVYAGRAVFVAVLLAGLVTVWLAEGGRLGMRGPNNPGRVGEAFFVAIVGTQMTLVLMVAPAATAGAICEDRTSGALDHLLTTDLSSTEILLGKLAARLAPVLGMIACGLPVAALATLLGGIDPMVLLRAYLLTVAVAVLGGSTAMAISTRQSKTHEVLMSTFAVWAVWLLGVPAASMVRMFPIAVDRFDPFRLAMAPYWTPSRFGWGDVLGFVSLAMAASIVLIGVAIVVLRSRSERIQADPSRPRFQFKRLRWFDPFRWTRLLPGPSLDGNPVLWREWHYRRPSRWGLVVWGFFGVASAAFTVGAIVSTLASPASGRAMVLLLGIGFQASIGLLLLSVWASSTLATERVTGNLDVLMATPMSSSMIVWGTWWATFRLVPWLAMPVVLIDLAMAVQTGRWLAPIAAVALMYAYGAAVIGLGLVMAMRFRSVGRAVAATVGLYLVPTVGWFFLIYVLNNTSEGALLALGSPFYGPIFTFLSSMPRGFLSVNHEHSEVPALGCWILAYTFLAILLLTGILRTFDRRMGRGADWPWPVRRGSSLPHSIRSRPDGAAGNAGGA